MTFLEDLGSELDRAVRADAAQAPRRWRRLPLLAFVAVLGVGGVAAAATTLIGDPVEPPRTADVPRESTPVQGSARFGGAPAADPDGRPAWEVRLTRSRTGERCLAVGQVVRGRFGIVGLDDVFRELPVGAGDVCTSSPRGAEVVAGARPFVGRGAVTARTVVAGLAGPQVKRVDLEGRGMARGKRLELTRARTFVAALTGLPEDLRPAVIVTALDGRKRRIAFADTGRNEVADPDGGVPWAIEATRHGRPDTASSDLHCAQATRPYAVGVPGAANGPGPVSPIVCGRFSDASPFYVLARRFVPTALNARGVDARTTLGLWPARTLVYGAIDTARAKSIVVSVPGAGSVTPRLFDGGGFLAVLDGRVDPRAVTVRVKLNDGRDIDVRGSQHVLDHTTGRPVVEPPVPAWRSVKSQSGGLGRGFVAVDPRATRTSAPVKDPAGGPDWVIRSFEGPLRPGERYSGTSPKRFLCLVAGPIVDGQLRDPTGARVVDLDAGRDQSCIEDNENPRRFAHELVAFTSNVGGYQPPLDRIVVRGLAPHARDVELRGVIGDPDRSRHLTLTGPGAFLELLPGDARGRLSLRVTRADGKRISRPLGELGQEHRMRLDARAPDPDGAAPWGVVVDEGRLKWGRVVLGRLAHVNASDGSVLLGRDEAGSSGARVSRTRPINLIPQPADPTGTPTEPTAAQIQRRTLHDRSVVVGNVHKDVVSLQLRTPRDVRTIRPSGHGRAFIAVYDGGFRGGEIVATATLKNGSRVTVRQPAGLP